jgi:hypothetical protein
LILSQGEQIIKTRDDYKPILIRRHLEASNPDKPFQLESDSDCAWAKPDEFFGPEKLRTRVEPWLTALVQSEHLSLLIGSGLSHAIHRMATEKGLPGMETISFDTLNEEITTEAERSAKAAGREKGNFEDQIRVANELLRGLQIIAAGKLPGGVEEHKVESLKLGLTEALKSFANSIIEGERNIATASTEKREQAFIYLVSFLMSFSSRTGARERLHLFTTNYDRIIEAGADVAGLRLIDRFVGTLTPIFRASRLDVDMHYNPPGMRGEPRYLEGVARFTKLHGSADWLDHNGTIRRIALPFGATDVSQYIMVPGLEEADALRLMIYPNSSKDRETTYHPYIELFRDFASSICRPNSSVICYGYSFGDEHINRVIEDMLTIPSAQLVVISRSDPLGRIMRMYQRLGRYAQVTLLIGDHLGDLQSLVDHYLPKPAIDRTTFRMAELLKARWGTAPEGVSKEDTPVQAREQIQ